MDAAAVIRTARAGAGLSLRGLAGRAGTSHATLSAYETGRVDPSVHTVDRIVRAAGFDVDWSLARRAPGGDRGRELVEALELAALFPARHRPELAFPPFGVA
jgi:transcriptional regulator with XRE-family HTH domain